MPFPQEQINALRWGVAAASLGMNPSHTLENKFAALQKAGHKYTELGFSGYVDWVRQHNPHLPATTAPAEWSEGGEPDPTDDGLWAALYENAQKILALAASYGLTILVLQPLNQFEGWPASDPRSEWVRRKAEKWLRLCAELKVELIQVGSNDHLEPNINYDAKITKDLHWLAELASKQTPPVKIAYEVWSFGKNVTDWEHTWELVKAADHPNLGLCLDTGHFPMSATYGWDPTTGEGFTEDQIQALLTRIRALPAEKIFYIELSDMLKPTVPLGQGSPFDKWKETNEPARGDRFTWAVCGRPVPLVGRNAGEIPADEAAKGARVVECLKAILDTGFNGLVMFEFFEAQFMEPDDADVPIRYAKACSESEKQLKVALAE